MAPQQQAALPDGTAARVGFAVADRDAAAAALTALSVRDGRLSQPAGPSGPDAAAALPSAPSSAPSPWWQADSGATRDTAHRAEDSNAHGQGHFGGDWPFVPHSQRPSWPPASPRFQRSFQDGVIRDIVDPEDARRLFDGHGADMSAGHLALLAWRVAKLATQKRRPEEPQADTPAAADDMPDSANVLRAAGGRAAASKRRGSGSQPAPPVDVPAARELCMACLQALAPQLSDCSTLQLSQALWAAAKLQLALPAALIGSAVERLLDPRDGLLQDSNPRLVSNVAWALAQLSLGPGAAASAGSGAGRRYMLEASVPPGRLPHLWRTLLQAATAQAHQFNGQDCANLLWACAAAGAYDGEACTAVARRAAQQAAELRPQASRGPHNHRATPSLCL